MTGAALQAQAQKRPGGPRLCSALARQGAQMAGGGKGRQDGARTCLMRVRAQRSVRPMRLQSRVPTQLGAPRACSQGQGTRLARVRAQRQGGAPRALVGQNAHTAEGATGGQLGPGDAPRACARSASGRCAPCARPTPWTCGPQTRWRTRQRGRGSCRLQHGCSAGCGAGSRGAGRVRAGCSCSASCGRWTEAAAQGLPRAGMTQRVQLRRLPTHR